jgi:hopanoid C-3 methylase
MKILLIKPPLNRNLLVPNHDEPLELEYLAAAAAGHDVRILDMRIDANLDRALSQFRPSFVGITAYTCDYNNALSILQEVKKFDRNIQTGVGGHHATVLPADFALPSVDVIFLGPADDSFKEYIGLMDAGRSVEGVNNIALVRDGAPHFTERALVNKNLDLLPFPDRRPTLQYRSRYRDLMNNKTGLVMTSRGCPFRCSFCACWKIMDGKYLARSPESVVDEIAAMPEEVELVCFADDNTLHSIRRAWRLVELVRERRIRKKFMMYARADTIVNNPDLMEALKDIGLNYLLVGIESFKDNELSDLNKKVTSQTNVEAVRLLKKIGIMISPHIIVNPEFTRSDFRDLFHKVCEMDLFRPVFTVLTPLPGTELYEKNVGRLAIRDYNFFDFTHSVLPTRLSRREFYRQYAKLYSRSYSFKRYFQSHFRGLAAIGRSSKRRIQPDPGRIPFLSLIMLHVFAFPKYWKVRKRYKTEPCV